MVGSAIVGGDIRFTAGSQALLGGVNIVVAMIGLFCIPVLIELVATPDAHLKVDQKLRGFRIAEVVDIGWKGKWTLLRSPSIGTVIGLHQLAGGSIAPPVANAQARPARRTPARPGRGQTHNTGSGIGRGRSGEGGGK